ncbi:hypothetical protein [Allorhizocola rhizosphaerae]|uniref:hypothetical protein n=1 Tax=Allorhizocola rhizosphaerae TaxID=1872709 RepID=UPI000E3BF199|nr:hypothetical protein [Allorhizocola rhizosphaerae]
MVLAITRELLDRYRGAPQALTWRWETTVVDVVLRHGSRSDAQALLPVFLEDPEAGRLLVPVFAQHGDLSMAEPLLAACVQAGRLRDGMPPEVLHAIGLLGYEPAERMLWEHVAAEGNACAAERSVTGKALAEGPYEHYESMNACLGLLHLSCGGLRTEIARALQRHVGAALFPEFLPVLATKTDDPSWLGKLVEWGDGEASTDCNGGLILGIALHGERARSEFIRLLWNPWWQAHDAGTGSSLWAYAGARVLGLSMPELYADLVARLKSDISTDDKEHCLATFVALVNYWVSRPWLGLHSAPEPTETYDALCDLLVEWSTSHSDDSLIGLARHVLDPDDHLLTRLHDLEGELHIRAGHELEIRTLASG